MIDFRKCEQYACGMDLSNYVTAAKFAKLHNYSRRRVQQWLAHPSGPRIAGALLLPDGRYLIPKNAPLPERGKGGNPGFKPGKRRKRRAQRKAG